MLSRFESKLSNIDKHSTSASENSKLISNQLDKTNSCLSEIGVHTAADLDVGLLSCQ